MAIPTAKHPSIERVITALGGDRREAIRGNRCIDAPIGCGRKADRFDGVLSAKEFTISGLCQQCQDSVFAEPEEGEGASTPLPELDKYFF